MQHRTTPADTAGGEPALTNPTAAPLLARALMTVPEAAERTRLSPDVLYRAFHRGDIEGIRAGRAVRLFVDSVEAWLARNAR